MEMEGKLRLADVFVSITDPRQAKKTRHDLVEVLVVAVNGVLAGADTFVEIEGWANEKLEWFQRYLKLEHGIPSHDAAHNLALLKHITMNLIRLDTVPRKGGIKLRRLIAATSDDYRAHLFGLG